MRVHIEHSVVLIVELAVRLGAGAIAFDQVLKIVVVVGGVAIGVHRHKACVLQKAGVHTATGTGKAIRY